MEVAYVGEHLLPGIIGNVFIVITFVASLLATYSFFKATNSKEDDQQASWRKLGRLSFIVHGGAAIGIVATLFYILLNHYFEYHYVWQHSSTDLPLRYIFSCFWEGQEGSFLLWLCWHVILGGILLFRADKWELPVMSVISLIQVFLGSMLLGVTYMDWISIGSNPFILLREHPEMINLPFVQNPNYLSLIEGRGLNPLLQNYWMTIHPPTLFLGFASTSVPFAYAVAGLWTRKYTEWIKPAIPWAYFGILVLGTGILMGGAWAYEALSFGGFWAWDPVENASLVPWLTLVGAGHLMLINKRSASSILITFVMTIISFLLVLYSTYLTRSGILGETSVHSFAEGMPGQLIVYLLFFVILSAFLIFRHRKHLPKSDKEEALWSREFWIFVGSMVLALSSFQIAFNMSKPVLNVLAEPFSGTFEWLHNKTGWGVFEKLASHNLAIQGDVVEFYNNWQIWFAIIVCLLVATGQYFKYKKTNMVDFFKKTSLSLLISLALTVVIQIGLQFGDWRHVLLFFTAIYATVANLDYWIRVLKGKIKSAGASIAHVGFGILILGALISMSKQKFISVNNSGIAIQMTGDDDEDPNATNIMLLKGDTLPMGNYYVTYKGSQSDDKNIMYETEYFKMKDGKLQHAFTLFPRVQTNQIMGNVPEPDTRHFWNRDIFTHITYADLEKVKDPEEYSKTEVVETKILDTIATSNALLIPKVFDKEIDPAKYNLGPEDLAVGLVCELRDVSGNAYTIEPVMVIKNRQVFPLEVENKELGVRVALKRINPETGGIELVMSEKKSNRKDMVIMQAIVFPYINLLWIGCIIMVIGTFLAILNRVRNRSRG